MRAWLANLMLIALVGTFPILFTACDGDGLVWETKEEADSGEQPDGDSGGSGSDGGATVDPDRPFAATWAASFGDDVLNDGATGLQHEYAVRLTIGQSSTTLSGSGKMFRFYRTGTTPSDSISVKLEGTASGDDAVFTVTSSTTGALDLPQTWYVRLADQEMVGMYEALDDSDELGRSGHATWRRVTDGDITQDTWVAAFGDSYGDTGYPAIDRTGTLVAAATEDGELSGEGSYVEQLTDGTPTWLDFNLVEGSVASVPQVEFNFGGLELGTSEYEWYGFITSSHLYAIYGQSDPPGTQTVARIGLGTPSGIAPPRNRCRRSPTPGRVPSGMTPPRNRMITCA